MARQQRKVDGGLQALADWVGQHKKYLCDDSFGLADIAAGFVLGYLKVWWPDNPWSKTCPYLGSYSDDHGERQSFEDTVPTPQTISDKVV